MDRISYDECIISHMEGKDYEETQEILRKAHYALGNDDGNPLAVFMEELLGDKVMYSELLKGWEDEFENNTSSSQRHGKWFNTFPKGKPSDTYQYFLGTCLGKTGFTTIMNEAKKQCRLMAAKYDSKLQENELAIAKTVVIFTDKWNTSTFRKYAIPFINYAYNNNVLFMFFLVTDFGVTRIPFLPWNRRVLLKRKGLKVTPANKDNALKRLMSFDNCSYERHGSTLTYYSNKPFVFEIDFKRKVYCLQTGFKSDDVKKGTIPENVLRNFACRVIDLADLPQSNYSKCFLDAPSRNVYIFGKHFEWTDDELVYSDIDAGGPIFKKMNEAFDNLFIALHINLNRK